MQYSPQASGLSTPGITILYDEVTREEGSRGPFGLSFRRVAAIGQLDTEQLSTNLRTFCEQMGRAFAGVTTAIPDYELNHIELTVETTAKGEIRFIGAASAEVKGGIKIVFERKK